MCGVFRFCGRCVGFLAFLLALLLPIFSEDTTMSHGPSQHYKERRNLAPSTGAKLIAGGLAGIITKTLTAPLERYVLYFCKDLSTITR